MKETAKQLDAFEYYYSLGEKRTLITVAHQFNVSERTAFRWSSDFNWQSRVVERDKEINEKVQQRTNNLIFKTKAQYRQEIEENLKILRKAIQSVLIVEENKETGEKIISLKESAEANNIEDLSKLMSAYERMYKILAEHYYGEPTYRTEVELKGLDDFVKSVLTDEELKEKLLDLMTKAKNEK